MFRMTPVAVLKFRLNALTKSRAWSPELEKKILNNRDTYYDSSKHTRTCPLPLTYQKPLLLGYPHLGGLRLRNYETL